MDNIEYRDARTILCATDFCAAAVAATGRAAQIAQASHGKLELMHVIPLHRTPVYRNSGWQNDRDEFAAEAMARLRAMTQETQAKFGVPVAAHLAFGVPHAKIAARAEATGARLVVVGSRGRRSLRGMFVGSTAYEPRRLLRAPLLIARNRSTRSYERALLAIDLSSASAAAAHAAADLFPDAALHFLYACSPLFESRLAMADASGEASHAYRNEALLIAGRDLDGFIRNNGLHRRRASSLVQRGYPPACIRQAAAELGASVVAFGTKRKSRLATLIASVGAEFLRGSCQDVLFVKAPQSLPHRPSCDYHWQRATAFT